MAYVNQEKKAVFAAALKKVVPAGWKYSLAVRNHSTIVMTISAAPVDLLGEVQAKYNEESWKHSDNPRNVGDHHSVNPYWLETQFTESLPTFQAILAALNTGNHDNSDVMTDYFDVGHYVSIHIGNWDKPFKYLAPVATAA
jgi:hypothetical protein